MSETETHIATVTEPNTLAYCSYCGLHTTKDLYIESKQMCQQCYQTWQLKQEVQDGKSPTPPQK